MKKRGGKHGSGANVGLGKIGKAHARDYRE